MRGSGLRRRGRRGRPDGCAPDPERRARRRGQGGPAAAGPAPRRPVQELERGQRWPGRQAGGGGHQPGRPHQPGKPGLRQPDRAEGRLLRHPRRGGAGAQHPDVRAAGADLHPGHAGPVRRPARPAGGRLAPDQGAEPARGRARWRAPGHDGGRGGLFQGGDGTA
ncbi:hypothetical protein AZA_90473 [Nitrospirillum viridazoti Y2]|nr:hypothetical protein AZA_90473 [Nitrospirillum amazonense Y2]